jgi:aminoglycoside phosphotransferase (APT) family kinase protein
MREFWSRIDPNTRFAAAIADDQLHSVECQRVHGDLTVANLIPSEDNVWIIDWELSHCRGPRLTDQMTYFLGDQQRRLNRRPYAVLAGVRERFFHQKSPEEQRAARLALAYLYSANSGLGRVIVEALNEESR